MTSSVLLAVTVLVVASSFASVDGGKGYCQRVVCYFTSWAQYRPRGGRHYPADVDGNLCTHVIHSFAQIKNGLLATYDWTDVKLMKQLNYLKSTNPSLKVLIAVGGWNQASIGFSPMARNAYNRKKFIDSVLDFLAKYKLNGLDLDWEYPTQRAGGDPSDKDNFVKLVKELKEAFRPFGYELSAAVAAGAGTVNAAYDIGAISEHLDFINLMAYDLHGAWGAKTNLFHHSSLHSTKTGMLDVKGAVKLWLEGGTPKSKLVLGIPLYAKTYTVDSDTTFTGNGLKGAFTRQNGMLAYYEVCDQLKGDIEKESVEGKYGPYAKIGNQWIGYDNENAVRAKTKYSLENDLGGVMVWDLSLDDFTGNFCGRGKYPLMNAINRACGA